MRRPAIIGYLAVAALVGGMGTWSASTRIAGAVVASGVVEVEGRRQAIQHPDGGVIGTLMVQDGDEVEAGDVLVQFDGTFLRSQLAIIEGQLFEILARSARLNAERDGADVVTFAPELLEAVRAEPVYGELIAGQERLFEARRDTLQKQLDQITERRLQTEAQVDGTTAQIDAMSLQRSLIAQELADQQSLLDRGLTQQSKVLSLQRESARLDGQLGDLKARVAQLRGQIAESGIESLRLQANTREEAITRLRDLGYSEVELREKRLSTRETLSRLDVRAPVGGIIYGRQVNTVGAVVRPADVMMYIVPKDDDLVITSRVSAIHIDQVNVGQNASLRFTTFSQRFTPVIDGTVRKVSADAYTDENTGLSYYTAEILPNPGELEKLDGKALMPGMPVEAYILTAERSPLSFLTKPLTDYFQRAFREG